MTDIPADQSPRPGAISYMTVPNPMLDLVRDAMAAGSIEMVKMFVTVYREERAEAARTAYHRAFARAKAEFTPIIKKRKASFGAGKASYSYEELDDVVDSIVPALSKYGLAHSWKTINPPDGLITVTCVLAHEDGYSEENTLMAAPDASGNKNAIQAVISAVTYLQRATLKAKCGLAAGRDDDAQASGAKDVTPISAEQIELIKKRIKDLGVTEATFYEVMSHHAGNQITKVEELLAHHVPFALKKFDEFQARSSKKAQQ